MTHKILVVDDEREIREELIEYLSGKGYDCLEASGVLLTRVPKVIDMVIEAVSAGELDKVLKAALGERRVNQRAVRARPCTVKAMKSRCIF